jgi:maltooligosyltrehalose trehalohydrolase
MAEIRVWAPKVRKVELDCNGQMVAMNGNDNGWWSLNAPFVVHGTDYAFRLDDQAPSLPDPRSAWQAHGVHGPSRWVDHTRFAWNDRGWQPTPLGAALIYELHVGTFTPQGTFEALIERLDYLAQLGVTHIELMPVAEFSGARGWGYDGVALYAPHQPYGGPEGLKCLVDACHRRGLAVLLDVVYNHLGPAGNYLDRFAPYFTSRYATPWGEAVNLDGPHSDQVRRFFIDNALMWMRDYHIDGLRIDAIHAFADTSAIHFLEQLAEETRCLQAHQGRHYVLIAESDLNDPRVIRPPEIGGYGIDAQWNEDFHHALHSALTGERDGYYRDFGRLGDLAKVLTTGLAYDGRYSVFRRRNHGRAATGISANRFVGYLQNHDQIGNRALGERSSRLLSPGQLKIGAALVLTAPFVPMLFQGEEWGAASPFCYFTDHQDPQLGEAVRQGRRKEFADFGWDPEKIPDPQDHDTFLRSKLDWTEAQRPPHSDILAWHQTLIALRRRIASLTDGRFSQTKVFFDDTAKWLIMFRGPLAVACNMAEAAQRISCSDLEGKEIVLHSGAPISVEGATIELPGQSVAVLADREA